MTFHSKLWQRITMPAGSEWPVYLFTHSHSGIDSLITWDHLHQTFQTGLNAALYWNVDQLQPKECICYFAQKIKNSLIHRNKTRKTFVL